MYVENESVSVKKLYITAIQDNDAGEYTCKTSVDGMPEERPIKLLIFSTFVLIHSLCF